MTRRGDGADAINSTARMASDRGKAAANGKGASANGMSGVFRGSASPEDGNCKSPEASKGNGKGKARAVDDAAQPRASGSRSPTRTRDGNRSSSTPSTTRDNGKGKGHDKKGDAKKKDASAPEPRKRRRSLALSDDSSSGDEGGVTLVEGGSPAKTRLTSMATSSTLSEPEPDPAEDDENFVLTDSGGSLHGSDDEEGLGKWTKRDQRKWQDPQRLVEDDIDYGVEYIIRWRRHKRKGIAEYRVRWENYDDYWNSWLPASSFNGPKTVDDFWKSLEIAKQGKRPHDCYPRYEGQESTHDSEDTENEVYSRHAVKRKLARRRKRRDIRLDRKAMRDTHARRHALRKLEEEARERKKEEKRLRKGKGREQVAESSNATTASIAADTAASTKRSESKSLSPRTEFTGTTGNDNAGKTPEILKAEADRKRELARQFMSQSDEALRHERRIARGRGVAPSAKIGTKPTAVPAAAQSSASAASTSSLGSSAPSRGRGGFRGAHHGRKRIQLLDQVMGRAPPVPIRAPANAASAVKAAGLASSERSRAATTAENEQSDYSATGGWDDDIVDTTMPSGPVALPSTGGWDDDGVVDATLASDPLTQASHQGLRVDNGGREPVVEQQSGQQTERPASKRARFASSPEPIASTSSPVVEGDADAPQRHMATVAVPNSTARTMQPARPRPIQPIIRGNAADGTQMPSHSPRLPPPGPPPPRPLPPWPVESVAANGASNLPVPLASSIGRPRPPGPRERPWGPPRPQQYPATTSAASPSPHWEGSPHWNGAAQATAASPNHLPSPGFLQSPPSNASGDITPMHGAQALRSPQEGAYDPQRWRLTDDLRGRISQSYHLILRGANPTNDPAREEHYRRLYDALIFYIIQTMKGGWKPEITDRMRLDASRTVVWVLDAAAPWDDTIREAATRHNFTFYNAAHPLENVYEIWPFAMGSVKMYTVGSLVRLLAKEASPSAAVQGQEDGEVMQDGRDNLFSPETASRRVKKVVHPWQIKAIKALLEGQQLETYLREVLQLDEQVVSDANAALVFDGEQLLDKVEVVGHEHTQYAKKDPFDEVELLKDANIAAEELKEIVRKVDEEVQHTLRAQQVALRRNRRAFVYVVDGSTGLDRGHIGTSIQDFEDYVKHPNREE